MKKNKYIAVKKSTYKRLKEQNAKLWEDIRVLIEEKGSINALSVETEHSMYLGMQAAIWNEGERSLSYLNERGRSLSYLQEADRHAPHMAMTPCAICGKGISINLCKSSVSMCLNYNSQTNECMFDKCIYEGSKIIFAATCSDKCDEEFKSRMLS